MEVRNSFVLIFLILPENYLPRPAEIFLKCVGINIKMQASHPARLQLKLGLTISLPLTSCDQIPEGEWEQVEKLASPTGSLSSRPGSQSTGSLGYYSSAGIWKEGQCYK